MCSVSLRRCLTAFNLNQCRKDQGNYVMGDDFLNLRVPLMEELVSKKDVCLWKGNS